MSVVRFEIALRSCRGAWKGARVAWMDAGELPLAPTMVCKSVCSCTQEVARRASSLFSRSVERSETYGKGATTEAFPVRESSQFSRWLSGAIPPGMD